MSSELPDTGFTRGSPPSSTHSTSETLEAWPCAFVQVSVSLRCLSDEKGTGRSVSHSRRVWGLAPVHASSITVRRLSGRVVPSEHGHQAAHSTFGAPADRTELPAVEAVRLQRTTTPAAEIATNLT